jgi:hypothetical protein
MTFDDLRDTLATALATEKIGTPVALRLHVNLAELSFEPAALLATVASWAESIFRASPAKLTARCTGDDRQYNVLLNYAAGQTLLLNIVRGSTTDSLQLLLVGNHGVVRLEGGELFDPTGMQPADEIQHWKRPLARSLAGKATVTLDA